MIGVSAVVAMVRGLDPIEIEQWIALDWVRPRGEPGAWEFADIDIARLRLIRELRHDLGLEESGLPVVLRLLDQLYAARRELRLVADALGQVPDESRDVVLRALRPD